MQKRLFINPLLYGAILGAASALVASVLFVLAGGALMFGFGSLNLFTLALGLRLIFTFTALPGLAGGIFAGYVFSRWRFERIKGVACGAAIGSVAALVAIGAFFAFVGTAFDASVAGLAVLVIAIAAVVSGSAAHVLLTTHLTRNLS